jgi:hypothetical protein
MTLSTLGNGVDSGHTPPQQPSCSSRVLAICSSDLCSEALWDMVFLWGSRKASSVEFGGDGGGRLILLLHQPLDVSRRL